METATTNQDDSSSANPSSIKSDDSSPQHDGGRGSPPPNCAICLGTCRNKSFTDSCLHQFCFKCLLTWSKVKAECPLCKQNFKSIIHNVRSNHQYEEYVLEQRMEGTSGTMQFGSYTAARRFRYRTTVTLPRRESLAIQELFMRYPFVGAPVVAPPPPARRHRSPAAFRRTVYRHNLWARPLPDFTGRFRDCSPEFYRHNNSQIHRLVPWLSRELHYLLNENVGHISYVISRILELLSQFHINSVQFREAMTPYFGDRTEHFLHELYCFASTPYDMTGYDRNVQYTTDTRISTMVNEVLSSSESEASVDSDIVMVSHSEPATAPGPSRPPPPAAGPQPYYPSPTVIQPPQQSTNIIPIETISHSDTDDDDEVMVVGYIKPPQDRTPEVVDLLESDSDVIVQESGSSEPVQGPSTSNLVKIQLKRSVPAADSDSEDSVRPPERRRRRRDLARSNSTHYPCNLFSPASPVTSPTIYHSVSPSPLPPYGYTPSSPAYEPPSPDYNPSPVYRPDSPSYRPDSPSYRPDSPRYLPDLPSYQATVSTPRAASPPPARRRSSSHYTPSPPLSSPSSSRSSFSSSSSSSASSWSSTTFSDNSYAWSTSTTSSSQYKKRPSKKKSKKKIKKTKVVEKRKNKKRNRSRSRSRHRDRQNNEKSVIKHSKLKSLTEKPKKSSKTDTSHSSQLAIPSTSGLSNKKRLENDSKHGSSKESKRLKSVVNVLKNCEQRESGDSTSSSFHNPYIDKKGESSRHMKSGKKSKKREESPQDSDSEDNKPLNLTLQKPNYSSS